MKVRTSFVSNSSSSSFICNVDMTPDEAGEELRRILGLYNEMMGLKLALLLWLALAVLISASGFVGTLVVAPRVGEYPAHVYKTIVAIALVLLASHLYVRLTSRHGWSRAAWRAGLVWLTATVAFEFLAGHYLFGNPWEKLFADYLIWQGRLWVLLLIALLLGPPFMARRLHGQRMA